MLERGSFIDQWERRDVLDARDLIPVETVGISSRAVIYDLDEYRRIVGDVEINRDQVREDIDNAA